MEKFKVGDKVYIDDKEIGGMGWYATFRKQYPLNQRVFIIREKFGKHGCFLVEGDKFRFSFLEDWLVPANKPVTEKPKTTRMAVDILKYANELMKDSELDDKERLNRLFGYIEATAREEQGD